METAPDGPPVVPVPERIDRRLRLGPFATAGDALKFVTYAAVGAVLAPLISPWLGVTIGGIGFGLSIYRPDGSALDERCATYFLWRLRSWGGHPGMRANARPGANPHLLTLPTGDRVSIVRTNGTPTSYLPPPELARRFELFRDMIRTVRHGFAFSMELAPMRAELVIPPAHAPGREDSAGAQGYRELVTLLCRRRWVRRIDLVLRTDSAGPAGIADLETRVSSLLERLASLDIGASRLQGRALADAARRWGWSARRDTP
ncbi:MAG TPA: hypothetical protein VMF04_03960 [Thermoplasmata archaeon]|nr:hypothetical protein [Thermoplasmata archaeon]